MKKALTRRTVLRGILNGGAVTVGLPLLNCFLNGNGTALADGKPLPVRFGTWFWGLGMSKSIFVPSHTGAAYDLPEEIAVLKPVQKHINLFTDLTAFRDGANFCHYTGWVVSRTGDTPATIAAVPGETIDVTVANKVGRATRFKALTAVATGDARTVHSFEDANTRNIPEISPLQFYQRLFGPDFQDPNAPAFAPNPEVMARRSALSPVMEQIKDIEKRVGAEDRAKLDQYFTGLRSLEQQFNLQLKKPDPIASCRLIEAPESEPEPGGAAALMRVRHRMMTELLVAAVACDQTRVFNMSWSDAFSVVSKPGYDKPHHTATHEEPIDESIGYQPNASWFIKRSMEAWVDFVQAFASVKEGEGTLLDNMLIFANTDVAFARLHTLEGMPAFTAGRAGGRVKTGLHIDGKGAAITRIGYTALRVMGIDVPTWGGKSNQTSKEFGEILA